MILAEGTLNPMKPFLPLVSFLLLLQGWQWSRLKQLADGLPLNFMQTLIVQRMNLNAVGDHLTFNLAPLAG